MLFFICRNMFSVFYYSLFLLTDSNFCKSLTRQAMYIQRNSEASLRNHCCCGKQELLHVCVYVCARALVCEGVLMCSCVRARARACVCVCVCG